MCLEDSPTLRSHQRAPWMAPSLEKEFWEARALCSIKSAELQVNSQQCPCDENVGRDLQEVQLIE